MNNKTKQNKTHNDILAYATLWYRHANVAKYQVLAKTRLTSGGNVGRWGSWEEGEAAYVL